jgi:hypothetical protein
MPEVRREMKASPSPPATAPLAAPLLAPAQGGTMEIACKQRQLYMIRQMLASVHVPGIKAHCLGALKQQGMAGRLDAALEGPIFVACAQTSAAETCSKDSFLPTCCTWAAIGCGVGCACR